MKKHRIIAKFTTLVLSMVFLFQMTALAEPLADATPQKATRAENTVSEVASLREESVKIFQNGNGNYVAAIYGEAVHYQDKNGNWQEIDNSLVPITVSPAQLADKGIKVAKDKSSPVAYYKNTSNAFEVNLPNVLTKEDPITVTYQGHTLGFLCKEYRRREMLPK